MRKILLYVLTLGLIYFFLSNDPLFSYLGTDVESLQISLVAVSFLLVEAGVLELTLGRKYGKVANLLLSRSALTLLVYSLLNSLGTQVNLRVLSTPMALATLSLTLYGVNRELFEIENLKPLQTTLNGIAATVLSYSIWKTLGWVYEVAQVGSITVVISLSNMRFLSWMFNPNIESFYITFSLNEVGKMIYFVCSVTVASALIASQVSMLKGGVFPEILSWFEKSQLKAFLVGFFLGVYFVMVRPILNTVLLSAQSIEWALVGFMTIRIYLSMKSEISKDDTKQKDRSNWKRYAQQMDVKSDEKFERIKNSQELFVFEGIREPLISDLTSTLSESGVSREDLISVLKPIIEYKDKRTPLASLIYGKRGMTKRNVMKREKVLTEAIDRIRSLSGGERSQTLSLKDGNTNECR